MDPVPTLTCGWPSWSEGERRGRRGGGCRCGGRRPRSTRSPSRPGRGWRPGPSRRRRARPASGPSRRIERPPPQVEAPGVLGPAVHGAVTGPVEIDLEAGTSGHQTGGEHGGPRPRCRGPPRAGARVVEGRQGGDLVPEGVAGVDGHGHDGADGLLAPQTRRVPGSPCEAVPVRAPGTLRGVSGRPVTSANMRADFELVRRLAAADQGLAIVSTTRADGTVHSSLVNAGVFDHPLTKEPAVALVAPASPTS